MKIDPYNHKEKYFKWKSAITPEIVGISNENLSLILRYVEDMEHGLNVSISSTKGARSYIRLNTIKDKMVFFSRRFEEIYNLDDITKVTERTLHDFFSGMKNGEGRRDDKIN